jgi:hypothetical protein
VPSSPLQTAQAIAGQQAVAAAQAAQAAAQAQGQGQGQGQGQSQGQGQGQGEGQGQGQSQSQSPSQSASKKPSQGGTSSQANVGGSSSGTAGGQNQDTPDAPLELQQGPQPGSDGRTASDKHDATLKGRNFEREPWFAKLPPELRKAIQAKPRREAPRGYEERLKRYFENVE